MMNTPSKKQSRPARSRIAKPDWDDLARQLDEQGCATTGVLLGKKECAAFVALYPKDVAFRSRIDMARHNFGRGEYKYFIYPLPPAVAELRERFYPPLAAIANRWAEALGEQPVFPRALSEYLAKCHRAGQTRPTPLMLSYAAGDYNCLHQDIYGEYVFPLQMTVLLSDPERDFEGGEFVLTEQRPRLQSRVEVVRLAQGEAVIFPVRHRPLSGKRGYYRANMRHGVSRIRSGSRLTLGIIFHDAR